MIKIDNTLIDYIDFNTMLSISILFIASQFISNPFDIIGPWQTFILLILKEIYLCYTFYHQYMVGNAYWKKKHPYMLDVNGIYTCVLYGIMVVVRVVLAGMGAAYFNFILLNWLTELALSDMAFLSMYWSNLGNGWLSHLFKLNPNQMDWVYGLFTIFYWMLVRRPVW